MKMDKTISFNLLKLLDPTTIWLIEEKKDTFIANTFPFVDCELIRELLTERYTIHALCEYNNVEQMNTFYEFITLWNLYAIKSKSACKEYRRANKHSYSINLELVHNEICSIPTVEEGTIVTERGCIAGSKFYSARFIELISPPSQMRSVERLNLLLKLHAYQSRHRSVYTFKSTRTNKKILMYCLESFKTGFSICPLLKCLQNDIWECCLDLGSWSLLAKYFDCDIYKYPEMMHPVSLQFSRITGCVIYE